MTDHHPAHMPKVIAHRGASACAPENTVAAIIRAAEVGAKAVEFDVSVTADGVAVLLHDVDLERCSDGTGPVVLKTLAEVQALDAGGWFDARFGGERVPTLGQALDAVLANDMLLNLEIKPTPGWEERTVRAIVETLQSTWPDGKPILVSSMDTVSLDLFHSLMPDVALGLIVRAVPKNWPARLRDHHCASVHCHHDFATPELATAIHAAGARLHVYTVNDENRACALFAMGVDAVFSDDPERILSVL